MSQRKIELLIFDCDGVLVDSEPIHNRIEWEAYQELGYELPREEYLARVIGLQTTDVIKLVKQEYGISPPPSFWESIDAKLFAAFRQELRPIPGIESALAQLPHRKCVASSSDLGRITFSLSLTGLERFFDGALFSAAAVPRGKPAPDLFLHAARSFQAAPDQCLVIEDSIPGVQAAQAAGMTVLGFTSSHSAARLAAAGATQTFDHMCDLPTLVLHQ